MTHFGHPKPHLRRLEATGMQKSRPVVQQAPNDLLIGHLFKCRPLVFGPWIANRPLVVVTSWSYIGDHPHTVLPTEEATMRYRPRGVEAYHGARDVKESSVVVRRDTQNGIAGVALWRNGPAFLQCGEEEQ